MKVRLFRQFKAFMLWTCIGLLTGAVFISHAQAQNGDVDQKMDDKKYQFELAKNWSFGWENYKNKQYERAAKYFWIVAKLDTIDRFEKVYRYLGDSYLKLDKADSAQIVFEIGAEEYPKDAHLHRMLGFLKAQREQIDEAIEEYEKTVALEPESEDDLMQLAALYAKADRTQEAIDTYDLVLKLNPDNQEARNNQTHLLGALGDTGAMIEKMEETRSKDSTDSRVRYDLGELYFKEGNFEKSIEVFKEYLTLSPNDVRAIEYLGNSYLNLDKPEKAIAEFNRILDIEPDSKRMMAQIGRAYKDMGRYQSAKTYANKALAVDGKYGLGWLVLGETYEASAEKCVTGRGGSIEFDDKLVYELARQHFVNALRDPEVSREAQSHVSFLSSVTPTKEDVFMHRKDKRPSASCYSWIPDSSFGQSFWNLLDARLN